MIPALNLHVRSRLEGEEGGGRVSDYFGRTGRRHCSGHLTSRPLEVFRPIHFRIGPSIVTPLLDSLPSNLIFLACLPSRAERSTALRRSWGTGRKRKSGDKQPSTEQAGKGHSGWKDGREEGQEQDRSVGFRANANAAQRRCLLD